MALFITFEGPEGGGKSTQAKMLADWMKKRNIPHILTKEPGTSYIKECKLIREIVLNPDFDLDDKTELLLFLADRAQHVSKLIKPTLDSGTHVICDRYADSTRVYQCVRGFSRTEVDSLIEFSTKGLIPDITFILDLPVNIGLKRAKAKINGDGDRMEQESKQFHEEVRFGFLKLAENVEEQRFVVIDVAPPKTLEEIHENITNEISKKIWGY